MIEILKDLSKISLANANEANLYASTPFLYDLPGAEAHKGDDVSWCITGILARACNVVFNARLKPENVDSIIKSVIKKARTNNVPVRWYVGKNTEPEDLGEHLISHGFTTDGPAPMMAIDLLTLKEDTCTASGLNIIEVKDIDTLKTWNNVCSRGFGGTVYIGPSTKSKDETGGFSLLMVLKMFFERVILTLKKVRNCMPRYYCGKSFGFEYKARGIGWRSLPLLRRFPYLTGDVIGIKLWLKPLTEGLKWEQGIISITPPDLVESELGSKKVMIPISDYAFAFEENYKSGFPPVHKFPIGEWWTRTLLLKGGSSFGQPCYVQANLIFQNTSDKLEQTSGISIAEFEVVLRDSTLLSLFFWGTGIILSIAALIAAVVAIVVK